MKLYELDPCGRFGERAEAYARYRPDYPAAAIDFVLAASSGLVVDLGAGTGIGSRQIAERGRQVVAIEPNRAMREQAAPHELVEWREGSAEETGLADDSAGIVAAFQAYHWFDPARALPEIVRILVAEGVFAAVSNERVDRNDFTREWGDLVRGISNSHPAERRIESMASIEESGYFESVERHLFPHVQILGLEGLLGRAASTSYLPSEGRDKARLDTAIEDLFGKHHNAGLVTIEYDTIVYLGQGPRQRRDG